MNDDGFEITAADWEERSVVNGPGERFVLWLQGCPFRCRGCFNPAFLPFAGGRRVLVAEMAERILSVPGVEGVTYSGGEPMAQARALHRLSGLLRQGGRTVVCYSGYTLEEIRELADPWPARLLDLLDVLIDGRYEENQRANLPWRGSRNQWVHFLSDAYRGWRDRIDLAGAGVELIVGRDGLAATGIFPEAVWRRLELLLKEGRA